MPAVQIAEPGHLFSQFQGNLSAERGEVNATVDFGITRHFEIGLNANHIPLYDKHVPGGPADAALLMNSSLATTLWRRGSEGDEGAELVVGMGGQAGVVGPRTKPLGVGWALARATFPEWNLSFVAGGYAGSDKALGCGRFCGPRARARFGGMAGIEYAIAKDRFHLMADCLVGRNAASVAVIGVVIFLPAGIQLAFGIQTPAPWSGNGYGAVTELTSIPHAHWR